MPPEHKFLEPSQLTCCGQWAQSERLRTVAALSPSLSFSAIPQGKLLGLRFCFLKMGLTSGYGGRKIVKAENYQLNKKRRGRLLATGPHSA